MVKVFLVDDHEVVRRGLIDRNPAGEVENLTIQRRKRYLTDEEFIAIRTAAHPASIPVSASNRARRNPIMGRPSGRGGL